MADKIDTLRQVFETIRDERRTYANTASRIGNAFLALLSYLSDAPFLRKDQEDTDQFLLKLLKGCVIGESNAITLNPDGSITCGSIRVNGSAIFDELVFNRQNVLEGDTYFTDKAIIESVEQTDLNQYTLSFRKEYDQDRITFQENDILLGKINNLDSAKTYYSFYLRITSIDLDNNTATCTAYNNADVPGGLNHAPVPAAKVIRWGNSVDKSRQNVWFVSSNDGRWLFLQGVNKPKIDDNATGSNYAGFIGLPPDISAIHDLLAKGVIDKNQPYLYFRGLIVQDLIRVDYNGVPEYTVKDTGIYDPNKRYYNGYNDETKQYETDCTWLGGCYWQCSVDSCIGSEPRFNNPDWSCLIGRGNFSVDIISSAGDWFNASVPVVTDLTATIRNAEMVLTEDEVGKANMTWTRESDDTQSDDAWNALHAAGTDGLILSLTQSDMPARWQSGSKVSFKFTAQVGEQVVSQKYSIA